MFLKYLLPQFLFYLPFSLFSQTENTHQFHNILKVNALSPFNLGYERTLGKHISASATVLYFPKISIGEPNRKFGKIALDYPTNGILAEIRYYFAKNNIPLSGFNIGAYYLFRAMDLKVHKISNISTSNSNTTIDATVYIPSEIIMYGGMVGWQKIKTNGLSMGLNIGLGYYKIQNIPDIYPVNNETELGRLLNRNKGFTPRISFTIGYAFNFKKRQKE